MTNYLGILYPLLLYIYHFYYIIYHFWVITTSEASLVALVVKNLPANAGDMGSVPGSGRSPGGGHGNSLQYSYVENPHGQRSLAGYSSRGRKESDTLSD